MMKRVYCAKTGKESFASRADAARALEHMRKTEKGAGSVYWCEACQAYHVTHMSYREGKNLRSRKQRKSRQK